MWRLLTRFIFSNQIMEKYHILALIGEGSFGKVYKGRRKESKEVSPHPSSLHHMHPSIPGIDSLQSCSQIVALKFIPKLGKSGQELQALQREITIMQALRHDNIVALYDWIETDSEVTMAMHMTLV